MIKDTVAQLRINNQRILGRRHTPNEFGQLVAANEVIAFDPITRAPVVHKERS